MFRHAAGTISVSKRTPGNCKRNHKALGRLIDRLSRLANKTPPLKMSSHTLLLHPNGYPHFACVLTCHLRFCAHALSLVRLLASRL